MPRLGQGEEADDGADRRDRAERDERGAVTGADHNEPGQCRRQCRADALRSDDGALRDVESAGVAHEVGDDDGEDRAKNTGADAIEKLHADQPEPIVRERIERSPKRQDQQCGEERLWPQRSAFAPTSIANGTITNCAATMQADIRLVPMFLSWSASFCPTSGSMAALER